MLEIDEANSLMEKLIELRTKAGETKDKQDIKSFEKQLHTCVDKFSYIITMRTAKYKNFINYDDLNQEGFEALLKGLKNYDPKKGNIFWWIHKYTDTRIARCANLHTTIRYPLKVAKEIPPHKENLMPLLIDEKRLADKELEISEMSTEMKCAFESLTNEQKNVVSLAFGFDGDKPLSVSKICYKLNISRAHCVKIINVALSAMRENIKQ